MASSSHIRELVDGIGLLLGQHLTLARLELKEDAQYVGVRVGIIAGLSPLVLVGYAFLCLAGAKALEQVMSPPLALLSVGGANLMLAVVGAGIAGAQLSRRKMLSGTMAELEATRLALVPASEKETGR